MENFNPASEKQIAYLKKLGYEGDTDGLTSAECSELINQYSGKKEATKNEVATKTNNEVATKKSFSNFMQTVGSKLVANTITDEKRKVQFISNIVSAVSNNPVLQECDQVSVISAGLQAEALHFPVNNQLGYCYIVPYNDKKSGMKKGQFQIGYKGYIQLAIRSGYYKKINVTEVREGELKYYDPLNGPEFEFEKDFEKREKLKVIGYAGYFQLNTGFEKYYYISDVAMLKHADTYSQAFDAETYKKLIKGEIPQKDMWKYSSFWYKSFDEMALKTVIRQLLSKWGIMSVEMQQAYDNDMAAFDIKGNREYIDSKEYEKANIEDVINMQQQESGQKDLFEDVVEDDTI